MNENINIDHEARMTSQTIQDFKHAVLILSVAANLAIFITWIVGYAGVGAL